MQESRHKAVCFDFDGVCATYDKWLGVDVFGEPIPETAKLLATLQVSGFRCILWTTRKITRQVLDWLYINEFFFDSINSCDHNPIETSNKPIADMYIDDRGFRFDQDKPKQCCDEIIKLLCK